MSMKPFDIEQAKIGAAEIAKKHNLKLIVLFGSQATGRVHEKSDIDIAVLGSKAISFDEKLKLIGDFSNVLKREDVEVVDLATASPTLLYVVVENGKTIYEEAPDAFLEWKLYAITVWMETAWLRNLRNKKLLEWAHAI